MSPFMRKNAAIAIKPSEPSGSSIESTWGKKALYKVVAEEGIGKGEDDDERERLKPGTSHATRVVKRALTHDK